MAELGTDDARSHRPLKAHSRGAPKRGRLIRSRLGRWGALGIALVTTVAFLPNAADASHADIFELDGDMADATGAPPDWTTFFGGTGNRITPLPTGFLDSGFDADYAFPDPSTFTSGSKDTLDVGDWACTDSNNLGGKFDIVNAYGAIYEVPATAGTFQAGDQLLFFGIERAATEGDGAMGFWFLHNSSVNCEKVGNGKAPSFTGHHVDGDIFVAAGFSNGGTQASVTAYEWVGGADGSLDVDNPLVTGQLCSPTSSHTACGIVNTAQIPTDAGKPWPSPDKNGGALDVNAFYEGFITVPAAEVGDCFATFVANTRSSTSPTSTIMDFSRGTFPTCQPSTALSATPTVANPEIVVVGQSVTYSFTETNDGNVPLTNVSVTTDNTACNTAMTPTSVATLAKGASQVFSCTLTTSGTPTVTTITGTGSGTSQLGNVTWCQNPASPPANTICDQDERATAKSVSILPGTNLNASASPTTAKEGDTITYTITEQNDGTAPTGFESALALSGSDIDSSNIGCDSTKSVPVKSGGDQDALLEPGETWTWTCTVTAPAGSFDVTFTGTGTILAGTSHAMTVTGGAGCVATATVFCDSDPQTGEEATVSVSILNPDTQLTVTADAVITYTFKENNASANTPLTPPTPGNRSSIVTTETSFCNVSAVAYQNGDGDNDNILDPGETWTLTCQGSLTGATTDTGSQSVSAAARGHGTDSTNDDITFCTTPGSPPAGTQCDQDERDSLTVAITNNARG